MGIHLKCRRMENGIRKIITIVLGAALIAGAWSADAHAASANAPVPKSVTYQGKGKVQVIFREKVRYRDPKVIVRDEDGKKYKTKITLKGGDIFGFTVRKCKKNQTYTFRIKGIKVRGFKKFVSVDRKFRSSSRQIPTVESVQFDSRSSEVEIEFQDDVEWKDPSVTFKRKGKTYRGKIIDKEDDEIIVKCRKLKYGKTYKYTIRGIRLEGMGEYVTLKGKFRAVA